MRPVTLRFPQHVTVHLPEPLRSGLETIADREQHESDEELVQVVLSRGIVVSLAPTSAEEVGENLNEAKERMKELRFTAALRGHKLIANGQGGGPRSDPSHVPFGLNRTWEELHAQDAEHDRESARMRRDLGLARDDGPRADEPVPHRHVERYLATFVTEELRQSFEDYLDAHPDLGEEEALATLLQRALDQEGHQGPKERKANDMVQLAEKLCAKAARRCSV